MNDRGLNSVYIQERASEHLVFLTGSHRDKVLIASAVPIGRKVCMASNWPAFGAVCQKSIVEFGEISVESPS